MKTFINVILLTLTFIFTFFAIGFAFSYFYTLGFFFFLGGWGCFLTYWARQRLDPEIKEKIKQQKFKKAIISVFFKQK
jgi:hypothetical protein